MLNYNDTNENFSGHPFLSQISRKPNSYSVNNTSIFGLKKEHLSQSPTWLLNLSCAFANSCIISTFSSESFVWLSFEQKISPNLCTLNGWI